MIYHFVLQEKKLQDEILELNSGLQNQDAYIEERRAEFKKLESHISKYHDGFRSLKKQRDELQDKRKYDFALLTFFHLLCLKIVFCVLECYFVSGRYGRRKVNFLQKLISSKQM